MFSNLVMDINIAVPGVDDLLDELKQLSPVSPLNFKDCQLDGRKISCSPNGSDSSGISSLDSEEIKVNFLHYSFSFTYFQIFGLSFSSFKR